MRIATGYVFPLVVWRAISLVTPPVTILPPVAAQVANCVENVPPIGTVDATLVRHGAPLAIIMSITAMLDPVFLAIMTTFVPSQ